MSPPQTTFKPIDFKQRFPALDGIRAMAILLVFAAHYGGGEHGGIILNLLNDIRLRGWTGVDLFFVLSGFLITGILYDTRHDSKFFVRFFARRSVRIFPIYYLVFFLLLLLTPILGLAWQPQHLWFLVYLGNFASNLDPSLSDVQALKHPLFRITLGHLWSLCVEEQFYLLWPIAVWFVRDRIKLIWTAGGVALLALALRCLMVAYHPLIAEQWIDRTLPFRMDTLVIGGVLALLLRGPNADRWQRLCTPLFLLAFAALLAVFHFTPAYDSPVLLTIGLTFTALASTGLIGLTLKVDAWPSRLLSLKPIRTLGKYSYGFYVYHLLFWKAWIYKALVVFENRFHSKAIAGVLALSMNLVVTFIVAKLSYDFFEVRFLRLKQGFEYDSEQATHQHAAPKA